MLTLEGVTAGYGAVQVLNGVSFEVRPNTIAALLGGNGTGKSTILKAISGLIRPTAGSIRFDGEEIAGWAPYRIVRRGLVQVTQGKEAYPSMTVEENLLIGAYAVKDRRSTAASLEKVYAFFPALKQARNQYAAYLSGGQLQMLCIGRGLMAQPKMLLLDEPSAALAPMVVLDIFQTIGRISRDGLTVLLVEQNVRMALLLAEHGFVIRDGIVHLSDAAPALMQDNRVREAYFGGTVSASKPPPERKGMGAEATP